MVDIFNTSCVTPISSYPDFSDYRLSDMASANNAIIEFIKCSNAECRIGIRFGALSHKTIVLASDRDITAGYYKDAVVRIPADNGEFILVEPVCMSVISATNLISK